MKKRYPETEDWYRIRFNDEVHFGYGLKGKLRIIRKLREQYCPNCIQENREREEKDMNAMTLGLCWAMISSLIYNSIRCREIPTER